MRLWTCSCRSGHCCLTALRVQGTFFMSRESSMSHAEDFSKPLPVFIKLADMLRHFPGVQFIFAKVAALLRGNRGRGEPRISELIGETPGVARSTVDEDAAVLQPPGNHAVAEPETDDQSEREKLIRRRWTETGIKMWNPDVHGAGHA